MPSAWPVVVGSALLVLSFASQASAQGEGPAPGRLERVDQFGSLRVRTVLDIGARGDLSAATELRNESPTEGRCVMVALWFLDAAGRDVDRRRSERFCVEPLRSEVSVTSSFSWRLQIQKHVQRATVSIAIVHGADQSDVFAFREPNRALAARLAQALQVRPPFVTKGEALAPHWNAWLRERPHHWSEATSTVTTGKEYVLTLDLAPYLYVKPGVTGSPGGEGLRQALQDIRDDHWVLKIKPVLLGRGLKFLDDGGRVHDLSIEMPKLRKPEPPLKPGESFADFAWRVKAGRLEVAVEATEVGCAALALSIWNRGLDRPLDHLVHWVTVVDPAQSAPSCPSQRLTGRQLEGDLLAVWWAGPDRPIDAALHIFELQGRAGTAHSHAVFAVRGNPPALLAWRLVETPSSFLVNPNFLARLADARSRRDYKAVGQDLRKALFTAEARDQREADRALAHLETLVRTGRPTVFARLVDANSQNLFYPLGLASVGAGFLGDAAHIVQPLPRESLPVGGACIADWTSVVPTDLGDSSIVSLLNPSPPRPIPGRISDPQRFLDYVGQQPPSPRAEGIVLLAHHQAGSIWFSRQADGLRFYELKRRFGAGSVAVLAACAVGNPRADEGRLRLLSQLNEHGIDAMVVSPFEVPTVVGVGLAIHFATQLDAVRATASRSRATDWPDLAEVYRRARASILSDPQYKPLISEAMLHEFILAGNTSLRLCPSGGTR